MQHYEYIIAGGGMAGLSLAYHLVNSSLKNADILILDREYKQKNDRTWCYWVDQPHIFDSIAHRRWDYLWYIGSSYQQRIPLTPYRYQMVRGIDFYQTVNAALNQQSNIVRRYGEITDISDIADGGAVTMDGSRYTARYVFDARFNPRHFTVNENRYHFLKQHFVGWEIETDRDVFDPQAATLFDFRTPQHNEMRFFYLLPFSPRRAIVEFTLFSYTLLQQEQYEQAIREYLQQQLQLTEYRITDSEQGVIPMTDQPFPRQEGHILRIGTNGGMVKASTGFAFFRTQQDSAAIVESLVKNGHPFKIPRTPARYRLFDSMLLQLLYRRGELAEPVFTRLFQRNPIARLFRFLDEQGNLAENLLLMKTTRWRHFLRALWKIKILRQI